MMPRPLRAFSAVLLLVTIAQSIESAVGDSPTTTRSNPSTTTKSGPVHGLNLSVYPRQRERAGSWDYELFELDEFSVPRIAHPERRYFQRIDPQIAYGGKDGVAFEGDHLSACAWTGYIRLPVAGTYHLATASERGSAVYVNGARVALNGNYGGTIPSEHFEYPEGHGARAPYDAANQQYSLPISVSGPRVFPIEVRFYRFPEAGKPPQITLYWVTPDSPKGPGGKPLLHIVPTDSLFAELPQQHRDEIEAPPVSAAHCTISCDRLYLAPGAPDATVRVRLADRAGRGVPGKRVFIWQSGSRMPGVLEQPSRTTDDNGETVAVLKPAYDVGELRLYAFDMTDLVQVPQVCYTYNPSGPLPQFFPWGSSPYFDDKFEVSPKPMVAGKPITITVPLTNRTAQAESVYVAVESNAPNIGAFAWNPCGRSEPQTFAPGESGAATAVFTLKEQPGKVCFRLTLWRKGSANKQAAATEAIMLASVDERAAVRLAMQDVAAGDQPMETRQQNIGPVIPNLRHAVLDGMMGGGLSGIETGQLPGRGAGVDRSGGAPPEEGGSSSGGGSSRRGGGRSLPPTGVGGDPGAGPPPDGPPATAAPPAGVNHAMRANPSERGQSDASYYQEIVEYCDEMAQNARDEADRARNADDRKRAMEEYSAWLAAQAYAAQLANQAAASSARTGFATPDHFAAGELRVRFALEVIDAPKAAPPPSENYYQLAAAPTDTAAGYLIAVLTSAHRAQRASAANNSAWAAKHFTAQRMYADKLAAACDAKAAAMRSGAESVPPSDPKAIESRAKQRRADLQRQYNDGFNAQELEELKKAGVSAEQARAHAGRLLARPESPVLGDREQIVACADDYEQTAALFKRMAAIRRIGLAETMAAPLRATFTVFNPRETEATINLLIRGASMPAGSRLAIVDADPAMDNGKPVNKVVQREPGIRYDVTLPAKGKIEVASTVQLAAELAENTLARWAVEGWIGQELLGGIMHEMVLPAFIPDLELPPVGAAPITLAVAQAPNVPPPAAPSRSGTNWLFAATGVATLLVVLTFVVLLLARKRRREA